MSDDRSVPAANTFSSARTYKTTTSTAGNYRLSLPHSLTKGKLCHTQGRLSPVTPWSKFPLPSLPPPFPPFPSPPLRSRPPLLRLGGLGERFSSPSGSGRSPAAKRYLVNFRLKISPLVATIFGSFSGNETSN